MIENFKVNVILKYSYSNEIENFQGITIKLNNKETILLNDLLKEISKLKKLDGFNISYYNKEVDTFILCGEFPFFNKVTVPFEDNIILLLRLIINKTNMMKMEFKIEENEILDENMDESIADENKCRRSKERKRKFKNRNEAK